MTKKEALFFFQLEADFDLDEFKDAKEDLLFELKTFFISRAPIEKLFHSRLKKLEKIHEVEVALGIGNSEMKQKIKEFYFADDDILTTYQNYQMWNKSIKKEIFQSNEALEIYNLVVDLLLLEKMYAEQWFSPEILDETIIVSKERDPMEILSEIQNYQGKTFTSLKKTENSPSEILLNEMKRLSLLFYKY